MSRPKVLDHRRRRTFRACDICKKRKQKCDGQKPCLVCVQKNFVCAYTTGNKPSPASAHTKPLSKRRRDTGRLANLGDAAGEAPRSWSQKTTFSDPDTSFLSQPLQNTCHDGGTVSGMGEYKRPTPTPDEGVLVGPARDSTVSTAGEEAILAPTPRMLQDRTGRLLYIGESATLSYLQMLRRMVESISGVSPFTSDPLKGSIVEAIMTLPPNVQPPCQLPDRQTAEILVTSYFINTIGLIEVFDNSRFHQDFDACYANPLNADRRFLCLLFLAFAIGLVTATPVSGTIEEAVISRLRSNSMCDQAELFFRSSKCLGNPLDGFEDADFWSIQALALMSVYMLFVSKRNAAFVYHGMAVRSAISMGLHRRESMAMFHGRDLTLRCSVWKALYVLDRFIAASLGRPPAIHDDECTIDILQDDTNGSPLTAGHLPLSLESQVHLHGIQAAVRSSRIISAILKEIYAKRRVSSQATKDIVNQCGLWTLNLPDCLHAERWKQTKRAAPRGGNDGLGGARVSPAHGVAVLHVHLLHYHSIILLTRPFLLFLIQTNRRGPSHVSAQLRARTERFSEACVATSYQTIAMIQAAREAMYLPQRNPFVMYFLFTAALLIMSNEFVALFHNPAYGVSIKQSISAMEYFSAHDPQAERLLWILRAMQDVVTRHTADGAAAGGSNIASRYTYHADPDHGTPNPLDCLFSGTSISSSESSASVVPTSSVRMDMPDISRWKKGGQGSNSLQDLPRPPRHDSMATLRSATISMSAGAETIVDDSPQVTLPNTHAEGSPVSYPGTTAVRSLYPDLPPVSQPPLRHQGHYLYGSTGFGSADPGRGDTLDAEAEDFDLDYLWSWPESMDGAEVGHEESGSPRTLPHAVLDTEHAECDGQPQHAYHFAQYSNYGAPGGYSASEWNAEGPNVNTVMAPHSAPLYRSAEFG